MTKKLNKKNIIFITISLLLGIFIFLVIKNRVPTPVVVSTIPNDKQQDILETSQISVNFNQEIPDKAKNGISVKFDPQVDFDSTWLSNTYKIIPKKFLNNSQIYTAKVFYQEKEIYSFSFKTSVFSQEGIRKYGPQQSQDDYDYGQATNKIVEKYPFYTSLPIKTDDYVVYYDFERDQFAITFLDPNISPAQKELLIKDAIERIKGIGAKEPIRYYTQP